MSGVERGRIAELMEREQSRFSEAHPESRKLHERGKESLLDGVPMNWMTRWPGAFPVFVATAQGADVSDVDGNEYADLCLGDTGAMTGHSPPATVDGGPGASRQGDHGDASDRGRGARRRGDEAPLRDAQLAVQPVGDGREPLRGPDRARDHRPSQDPGAQPLLPRKRRRDDHDAGRRRGPAARGQRRRAGGSSGDHPDRRDQRPRRARARARPTGTWHASWSSPL